MAKKIKGLKGSAIPRYICALLMVILFVTQFLPLWKWEAVEPVERESVEITDDATVTRDEEGNLVLIDENDLHKVIVYLDEEEATETAPEVTPETTPETTPAEGETTEEKEEEKPVEKIGYVDFEFGNETVEKKYSYSIAEAIWFSYKHPEFNAYFAEELGIEHFEKRALREKNYKPYGPDEAPKSWEFKEIPKNWAYSPYNNMIIVHCLILVLTVIGVVMCLRAKNLSYIIAPAAVAFTTIIGYLIVPEFRCGNNWFLHLVPAVLALAVVAYAAVKELSKKKKAK